jgi:DNA topoisomerase-1
MDIISKKNIEKYRDKIENFIKDLYTKKYSTSLNPDEFFIVLASKQRKVCIHYKKNNKVFSRINEIQKEMKEKDLILPNKKISFSLPYADILQHHLDQKKDQMEAGVFWNTLSHNGPYITWIQEPYKPHKVPIQYNNKDYKLTPKEEEVANFYARRITSDEKSADNWTKDATFNRNFWKDFKTYLTPQHKREFTLFKKLNFEKIRLALIRKKEEEKKNNKIKDQKKKRAAEKKENYGYAYINNIKEAIGNPTVEPASLYIGRGKNKLRGRIKKRINPEDITINIGEKSKVPKPPSGHSWGNIVHNHKARWVMKWKDSLTGNMKYVYMSSESQFKSDSDMKKFEKSRKLNKHIEQVRKGYRKNINSKNAQKKQLGTVLYLIDHYGIRVGGPNDDSTADTFGASTLLAGHVKMVSPNKIHLNFIGKDSIEFDKIMEVSPEVYKNIESFLKRKSPKTDLFDLISACDINNYLKSFDKDFSAKVFRTRLGSQMMYKELNNLVLKKNITQNQKKLAFEKVNVKVAKALNHQKSVSKAATASLKKKREQLKDLQKELKQKKNEGKSTKTIENRIKNKKLSIKLQNVSKTVATGTSKQNYIDPRLIVAWAKNNDVEIGKIYTASLQKKFKWAIDTTSKDWDYEKSPLLVGFEKLQPQKNPEVCLVEGHEIKEKPSKKPPSKKPPSKKPPSKKPPSKKPPSKIESEFLLSISDDDITMTQYSKDSLAVQGNTLPHKKKLKSLGGHFNYHLKKGGPGWIFSNDKKDLLTKFLTSIAIHSNNESDDDDDDIRKFIKPSKIISRKQEKTIVKQLLDFLHKYGYSLIEYENHQVRIVRTLDPPESMRSKSVYNIFYRRIKTLINNKMTNLGLLLIWALCEDGRKYKYIGDILREKDYINKYKKLIN